jgi:hypothetical protein
MLLCAFEPEVTAAEHTQTEAHCLLFLLLRTCIVASSCHNIVILPITLQGISLGQAFGWEAIMTFLLVVTIYSVAVGQPDFGVMGPLAIGLVRELWCDGRVLGGAWWFPCCPPHTHSTHAGVDREHTARNPLVWRWTSNQPPLLH